MSNLNNKLITSKNLDLNSLGFAGLPTGITYFKFEAEFGTLPTVTIERNVYESDLHSVKEIYNLVKIENVETKDASNKEE